MAIRDLRAAVGPACVGLALDFLPRPATMTLLRHRAFDETRKARLATAIPPQAGSASKYQAHIRKETHEKEKPQAGTRSAKAPAKDTSQGGMNDEGNPT
jgi:hypothetical protein